MKFSKKKVLKSDTEVKILYFVIVDRQIDIILVDSNVNHLFTCLLTELTTLEKD